MPDAALLLAALLAVALGSVLQAASGVGAGFVMVPMLAWIDIRLVPGPMIFGSLALSGLMCWRERGAIDRHRLPLIVAGLLPGSLLGGWVLSAVPAERLGLVFGTVLLLAIALTLGGRALRPTRRLAFAAGFVAGAMGASTGVGAPALAILYQREAGATVRATLALLYTIASSLIIVVLAAFGRFGTREAVAGAALMPGFLLGWWLAERLRRRLSHAATRPLVLGACALAALALIWRSLAGG